MDHLFINYFQAAAVIIYGIGFTTLFFHPNLIKKIIGFDMMDSAVFLFLTAQGYIEGATAPIIENGIRSAPCQYFKPAPQINYSTLSD